MRAAVRYYTRSGNTEKLAVAIAEAVGAKAQSVEVPLQEKAELLFLGCSYYGFDVDEAVKRFIAANGERIGRIICFGTSAMMRSVVKPMKKAAEEAGVLLEDTDFHCRGSFGPLHSGRPNKEDLKKAALFAENMMNKER